MPQSRSCARLMSRSRSCRVLSVECRVSSVECRVSSVYIKCAAWSYISSHADCDLNSLTHSLAVLCCAVLRCAVLCCAVLCSPYHAATGCKWATSASATPNRSLISRSGASSQVRATTPCPSSPQLRQVETTICSLQDRLGTKPWLLRETDHVLPRHARSVLVRKKEGKSEAQTSVVALRCVL
jgi:hypothetical protein